MLQVITVLSIAVLVALDQLIKLLVIEYLEPIGSLPLIDEFLRLKYAENTGAAFGSFSEHTNILSIFTFIVIIFGIVALLSKKLKFGVEYVCIALIIAGGIGNLIDRVFRGFVVDYIEPLFIDFAIFNFADVCVTVGVFLLVIYFLFSQEPEKDKLKSRKQGRRRY